MEKYFILIGFMVFLVQLTIQLIKNLPVIAAIPTNIVTLVLSIIYSETAMVIYSQYTKVNFAWYYYVGAFFGGLVIAYIAMFGWDKLKELWDRTRKID